MLARSGLLLVAIIGVLWLEYNEANGSGGPARVWNVRPSECPPGIPNRMACFSSIVTCPNVPDVTLYFGCMSYKASQGVVVLEGGNGGTEAYEPTEHLDHYMNQGNTVIQFMWRSRWDVDARWWVSEANQTALACRSITANHYAMAQDGCQIECETENE